MLYLERPRVAGQQNNTEGGFVSLTHDEVERIAQLARVGVTEADVTRFQAQLSVILDSFAALASLDTMGVPPTAHTLPLANIERSDVSRPSYEPDAILANAPLRQDDFIRVRRVLE